MKEVKKTLSKAERLRQANAEAMPDVKELVKKHGLTRVNSCLHKLRGKPVWSEPAKEPLVIDNGRMKLRCRRLLKSFCNPRTKTPPHWLEEMEKAYAHNRLRDGHICPHRGISCRGVIAESDGGVVCPGHGLKWNLETGQLVSRVNQTLQLQPKLF